MLRCSNADVMRGYLTTIGELSSHDLLLAAVVLTWSGDRDGSYALFDEATGRALAERRFHLAVAARERHAHHALLFGEPLVARTHAAEARKIAHVHGLGRWRLRASARLATIALDVGDLDAARTFVAEAYAVADAGELIALFAPLGVELAIAALDPAALASWMPPRIVDIAMASDDRSLATAAATACLASDGVAPLELATITRRA
ncbi:MAG TPA: hypothetical protein VK760_09395, partial [Candidatus Acidoferrales bacterium]|nr:hypothetical protein [Candidatus Acidoferrales bacterium]